MILLIIGLGLVLTSIFKTSSILALCIGIALIVAGVILIKDDLDEY